MPILHNSIIPAAADSTPADPVTRSLRFDANRSDSSLHRTFSSGSQTNWTFSVWFKRTETGATDYIFNAGYNWGGYSGGTNNNGNNQVTGIYITSDDKLRVYAYNGSVDSDVKTDMLFRDPSSFYHIFISWDSTQSSGSRYKIFVNGKEVSCTHTADSTNHINSNNTHGFGFYSGNTNSSNLGSRWPYLAGYLADCYFIDGTTLSTPVDNMIEATGYGSYKPKAFDMSSYGGNSFHLDMQPAHDSDLLVSSIDRNDGDTDFADAAQGHGLTVNGATEHSINVGNPFTGDDRAIYFDGSGDKIETGTTTDFNFGTGDFTIECWINPSQSASQYEGLIASDNYGGSSGARWTVYQNYSNIQFWGFNSSGSYVTTTASSVLTVGQWHHIAVTRESGTLKIYVDGVEEQSSTSYSSYDFSDDTGLRIGYSYGSFSYQGYMYDVRVVNGTAYTPPSGGPTSKLEAVTNTKLLLQPDKSDSSWGDESGNQTLTGSGDLLTVSPVASTPYDAVAKSTAMYFDGVNDYVETTGSSDFAFGTGDFTIEGWYYFLNIPSDDDLILVDTRPNNDGTTTAFSFSTDTTNGVKIYSGSSYALGGSLSTNTWHHIALVRDSGTLYAYIDGVPTGTTQTYTNNLTTNGTPRLGATAGGTHARLNGYVFDVRITKGTTRYTSNFSSSLPSAPFELNPVYIGGDQSGNKNHFQPMNDITMHDVVLDTPTKNYATLNPVSDVVSSGSNTFSEGNLTLSPSHAYNKAASTIAVSSGKWYAEVRYDSAGNQMAGIGRVDCLENTSNYIGQSSSAFGYVIYRNGGQMYHNGSTTSIFSSISSGDILQIALDLDSNTVWWGLNGTWVGTVGSSGGTSITAAEYYFVQTYRNPCTWNFGQDNTFAGQFTGTPNNAEFAYEIPTDSSGNPFNSLNTSNLAAPTVTPSEHFDVLTYAGSASQNEVDGLEFTPNFVWFKQRNGSEHHYLVDDVRGISNALFPNRTVGEDTTSRIDSFDDDGFTLKGNYGYTNESGYNYVAWNWKAHQTPPTPTSYSTTLTFLVKDLEGTGNSAWGTTKFEVFEGSTSLGTISCPTTYDSYNSEYRETWSIKTNDASKIKVVWKDVDTSSYSSANRLFYVYALLEDSSSNELALWNGDNYDEYGGSTPSDDEVFRAQTSSADESTTGVLEVQGPTVNSNSEKYNAAAGFTMFTYTGNSSTNNDTMLFNHSLGAPIDFAIGKCRSSASDSGGKWVVWHKDLSYDYYSLYLNEAESENDVGSSNYDPVTYNSAGWFANASTGSQHHVKIRNVEIYDGNNTDTVRMVDNSKDFVFYGFTGVDGHSSFGKVTGNGDSSDGVFCYLGFRPALIIMKNITHSSGYHWRMWDSARGPHNVNDEVLYPSLSNAKTTSDGHIDFLSNGFKLRSSAGNLASGYIYAAWAESPFSNAR